MQMMKIQINKIISSNWLNIIKSVKHLEKNHSKFPEAKELITLGGAFEVETTKKLKAIS